MQILNKRARLNYQILDTLEAGIELLGPEVKSIRTGQVSLDGAHIIIRSVPITGSRKSVVGSRLEASLLGMHTASYLPAGKQQTVDPTRPRRLLLHKDQIESLSSRSKSGGATLIPLRIYTKRGWIKIEIALVRGKKKWQKKEVLKNRDIRREMARALKQI